MINRTLTSLLLLVLAAGLMTACKKKEVAPDRAPIAVRVLTVGEGSSPADRDYVGTVEESVGSLLSFEVPGHISRLFVDEGDAVRQGQVIATIDDATLRDAYDAARATARQAADAHKRYGNLYKQGTVPEVKWIEIESKLEQAQATERIARTQLGHAVLRAPFSGVVANKLVEAGMNVVPGQAVIKLVKLGQVNVKVAVPETEVDRWQVGSSATLSVSALGGRTYRATVTEKGVEADPVAHTYMIKLSLPNPDGRLKPGMVCNVTSAAAVVEPSSDRLVTLPSNAVLLDDQNRRFVWLAVGGRATYRRVEIGPLAPNGVTVTSGLSAGDRVIVDGNQKVSEGMKVKF